MNATFEVLNRLAEPLRAPLSEYATTLKKLAGDHILALDIFGDAAAGTFSADRQRVQSAAIFDTISLDVLRQLGQEGSRLATHHIAAPLVFTPAYLSDSCDTFPLEFIEIQQRHLTIFGQDYFAPLVFKDADVRLQCERELKVISIGLHQGLLSSGGHEKHLKEIIPRLTEHLLRTLRGLLWLKAVREPLATNQVVQEIEKFADRTLPGLWSALGEANGTAWERYCKLYADVQVLESFVNGL